ncbi:MAG: response regulator [Nitrososphaeraceae archaeon]
MDDDSEVASLYGSVLEDRGHIVTLVCTAEECLQIYSKSLQRALTNRTVLRDVQPYDAVLLDYNMPYRNGLQVWKEILTINPHQRIIFVSAFVEEWILDSIKEPEFLQKPISNRNLIDAIEHKEIYEQLERLNIDVQAFKKANLSHGTLEKILAIVKSSRIRETLSAEFKLLLER